MTSNSKSILLAILSALISNVALAESDFYGSATYGSQSASRDGFSYTTPLGTYSSTPYGAGQSVDLTLGLNFGDERDKFLELSSNRLLLDGTNSELVLFEPVICTALAGIFCPVDTRSALNSDVKNVDLVLGWNFKPKEDWLLRPYIGVRQLSLENFQINEYEVTAGPNYQSLFDTKFKSIGLLAGIKIQKNIGQWFYGGDLSLSGVTGTRTTTYSNNYYGIFLPTTEMQEITINQWQTKFAVGRKFEVSKTVTLNLSLGYRIGSSNGFDAKSSNSYPYLDDSYVMKVTPKGFDLTIGWNF